MGILDNKMEAITMGYIGFRVKGGSIMFKGQPMKAKGSFALACCYSSRTSLSPSHKPKGELSFEDTAVPSSPDLGYGISDSEGPSTQ